MSKTFPPELLSRFDLKAEFATLNIEEKREFVSRYIEIVATKYGKANENIPAARDAAEAALAALDIAHIENIRILKNTARNWFADYVKEAGVITQHTPNGAPPRK